MAGGRELNVRVEADRPETASFTVQALRSVAGRAPGASEVQIESLGRKAGVDAAGNFVFRSMPSGTFTITARSAGRVMSRTVTLPAEPATIRDVVLGTVPSAGAALPGAAGSTPAAVLPQPAGTDEGRLRLQAGAFKVPRNAVALREQLESLGLDAEITRRGSLDVVTVGPFPSRKRAEAEARRLKAAGIDAVIVAERNTAPPPRRVSQGPHVLRAGAFTNEEKAYDLVRRLHRDGHPAFTAPAADLTIVYIGPFDTRREAVAVAERLRLDGFDTFVTLRQPDGTR
jgi:cell division protein FtsN